MGTQFTDVYNRFLSMITTDEYVEMTPEDTMRDLRSLLLNAIPQFEFPRKNLYDYSLSTKVIREDKVVDGDFVVGVVWDTPEGEEEDKDTPPDVYVEQSHFNIDLTSEEIYILALIMMTEGVQRQVTSIENTRMKYSGSDFSFTSQANQLAKLQSLLAECQRQSFHYQRLYKRRRTNANGEIESNWDTFRNGVFGDYEVRH